MRIRGKKKVPILLELAASLIGNQTEPFLPNLDLTKYAGLRLEIGCGRGSFITELARRNPNVFFIAIDKYTPIVARAAALAFEMGLSNIRFLDLDIMRMQNLMPEKAIDIIYLNFSDPWPRRRNEAKRLTHANFLGMYEKLLKPDGIIEMKTDNEPLFDWTLRSLAKAGWKVFDVDRNVPGEASPARALEAVFIQTEYESRFRALGQPIFHLKTFR